MGEESGLITKIQKWRHGQGVRPPRQVQADAPMAVGDEVYVTVEDGAIVITPARRVGDKKSLHELVLRIPANYQAEEVDWGASIGRET